MPWPRRMRLVRCEHAARNTFFALDDLTASIGRWRRLPLGAVSNRMDVGLAGPHRNGGDSQFRRICQDVDGLDAVPLHQEHLGGFVGARVRPTGRPCDFPWRPVLPGSAKVTLGHVDYLASLFYRGGGHMPRLSLELNRSRQQQQRTRAQLGLKKVSKDGRDV